MTQAPAGELGGSEMGPQPLPNEESLTQFVISGFDPAIHPKKIFLRRLMDARIKSGHDGFV